MTSSPQPSLLLSTLLEEYKELCSDIRARVDLQHRNVNLLVVFMTAVTGYLFNYWNDHGLDDGANSLLRSEIAALIAVAPLFANVFVWRHLDHDQNIIDKSLYIDTAIRPAVAECTGGVQVLGWERFLRERRRNRPPRIGPLVLLGNEHVTMLLFVAAYVFAGWYVRGVADHAGEAKQLFDVLIYVASALFLLSLVMSVITAFAYGRLGARATPPHAHSPAGAQADDLQSGLEEQPREANGGSEEAAAPPADARPQVPPNRCGRL